MPSTAIRFAQIATQLRREAFMPSNMPSVTPGDGIGAATVAMFLGLAMRDNATETENLVSIAAACLVACVVVFNHSRLRQARNLTEQTRIEATHQPTVLVEGEE
jgi:hypothetical protein